jgi:hypothetical protein
MRIYGISGLGADERVFKFLNLDQELTPIKWIDPQINETIEGYSLRLSDQIIKDDKFGIIGVSFGGLIAIELSKILNPEFTFLISSAETRSELRKLYRIIGRMRILKFLPIGFFNIPKMLAARIFGAKNSSLLIQILDDTNLKFVKWAVNTITNWENNKQIENCIKICGEKDCLMPPSNDDKTVLIKGGEHFMIVDKALDISKIINEKLKSFIESE